MSTVTGEQRPEYFAFAADVLGVPYEYSEQCKCLTALSDAGDILGVVIYTRMTQYDCMVTVALDTARRYVPRQFLAHACRVPFEQWGNTRITALVRPSNTRSLAGCLKLGFKKEGVLRRYFGDEDGILLGLLKAECKYLSIEVT